MITEKSAYSDFLGCLADQSQIAIDTEADSLHCYFEKLCLIQAGWPGDLRLIDPLAGLPLADFFSALRGKTLLFHDADYDLRLLRRSGEFPDNNIFDTMLAARLCGERQLGLAALVEKYFGVTLSKASRKANWAQRPLSSQMVEYALNDIRYLPQLAEIFKEKLEELERFSWFQQSCDRMVRATREVRVRDEENLWRISGYKTLSPHAQAILRAIWQWRDEESRKWDKPPFYVMSNYEMLAIAEQSSAGKKIQPLKFSTSRVERFTEVLQKAISLTEEDWPVALPSVRVRVTKQELDYFKKLKNIRDRVADQLNLDPSIIASKNALESAASKSACSLLLPWQAALLELEK